MTGGGSSLEKNQGKNEAEQSKSAAFVLQLLFLFILLSLGLELLPEGPLQLRDRQSEGEGAIRLWPDDPGLKMTKEGKIMPNYDTYDQL